MNSEFNLAHMSVPFMIDELYHSVLDDMNYIILYLMIIKTENFCIQTITEFMSVSLNFPEYMTKLL